MGRYGPGDEAFFDRVAGLYDRLMPSASVAPLAAALAFADRPIERTVDVGGGTGRAGRALREATDTDPSITVLDRSAAMLTRASADGFDGVRGDATRLPIRPHAVDAVTITDAVHHVPTPTTALTECVRVLAPGGVVVVREFDPATAAGRLLALGEHVLGMDSTFLTPDTVRQALTDAGARAYTIDHGVAYTVVGVRPRH